MKSYPETSNSNDADFTSNLSGSDAIVGNRAIQFTQKHLKNVWDLPNFTANMKSDLRTLTSNEVYKLIKKHSNGRNTI